MSPRAAVILIARREIVERLRQRSFLVSTGVTFAIVAVVAVLPGVIGGDGRGTYEVGVTGAGSAEAAQAAAALAPELDARIEVRRLQNTEAAEGEVRAEELDAAVVDGRRLVVLEELPESLEQALQEGARRARGARVLEQEGVSGEAAERALAPPPLPVAALDMDADERDEREFIAFAITFLLYGQLLTYGLWVAIGVVEEKASRVVEVLLATVRPRHLLAGKVLGIGLLGAAQLLLVVIGGMALALAAGSLELDGDVAGTIAIVLLFFPLGYALYACLFASAGALVSRQEDLQSTTTPLTLAIIASYLVSFTALQDAGGTLAKVASLVPISSPLVMPPRLALGDASALEVLAAVAILLATTVAVIAFGARVYERAVMRTGKPVGLREALRSPAR